MTVRFDVLNIRRSDVQEFVWAYLDPSQIRWNATKLDAMKEIEARLLAGTESLYGDMEKGVALRVHFPRPDVAMPHLLGDAAWFRSIVMVGSSALFSMGMKWVHVWTQDDRIARVVEAFGYRRVASLEGHGYVVAGVDEVTTVLSLDRDAFYRLGARTKLEVANG